MQQGTEDWSSSPMRRRGERPVGIIDIGSNSIRLVIYDGRYRTPMPLFNEKALCGLGQGLERTRRLNPESMEMAFLAIGRFISLAAARGVEHLDVLATAAVRDAEDGSAFVMELERLYNVAVRVLSGAEEAELAALGVLCGIPDADGLVADLGGGSLELILVRGGTITSSATAPLGVLRLADASEGDSETCRRVIRQRLDGMTWLTKAKGRTLYAVGGAWRTLARICITQMGHPLHVLDNFALPRAEAERRFAEIGKMSRKAMEKVQGVSAKRVPNISQATAVLERLLYMAEPDRVVFSVCGMREGQFFKAMPPELQRQDPLISACEHMCQCAGRFPEHGDELMQWMTPLVRGEGASQLRLRWAACLLGDVFWNEHPDYRAEQAFLRVLRLPFVGLNHRDRAGLALSLFYRYRGESDPDILRQAHRLLDDASTHWYTVVGLALRLGHSLSGGAPGLLPRSRLEMDVYRLFLDVPDNDPAFATGPFGRRFEKLAAFLGRTPVLRRVARP